MSQCQHNNYDVYYSSANKDNPFIFRCLDCEYTRPATEQEKEIWLGQYAQGFFIFQDPSLTGSDIVTGLMPEEVMYFHNDFSLFDTANMSEYEILLRNYKLFMSDHELFPEYKNFLIDYRRQRKNCKSRKKDVISNIRLYSRKLYHLFVSF